MVKDKIEAHERKNCPQEDRKPKIAIYLLMSLEQKPKTKFLCPPAPVKQRQWNTKTIDPLVVLIVEKHPFWRCPVFREKTPTQRTIMVACNKLCFFLCLNGQNSFRKCPKPRKWFKQVCSITHNTLLHGSERSFPQKRFQKSDETEETTASKVTVVTNKAEESRSLRYVTNFKGLLQMA